MKKKHIKVTKTKKILFLLFIFFISLGIGNYIYININPKSLQKTKANISYTSKGDSQADYIKKIIKSENINGTVLVSESSSFENNPEIISNTLSNLNYNMRVLPQKYFSIASLQKGMTAYAVYQLINDNKLKLNTHLNEFYPQIHNSQNITIRQLLCHQSGIYDKYSIPTKTLNSENQREKFILNNIHTTNNHNWHYASTNYGILASIIKKVTGENYFTYLNKAIFKPNNLKNIKSFTNVSNSQIILPAKVEGSKLTKALSILNFCSDNLKINTNFLESLLIRKKLNKYLSTSLGAGDLLATPIDYWYFINNVLLKNKDFIVKTSNNSNCTKVGYFNGYYFDKNYLYAQGLTDNYQCCFVKANYKTNKVIMLFTNNISFKKFKKVERDLCNYYFSKDNN